MWAHSAALGSVSVTTDANGALLHKQEFDPWGSVRAGDVPETTLACIVQRRDTTGLRYYNARYDDPVSGRFLSADTGETTLFVTTIQLGIAFQLWIAT